LRRIISPLVSSTFTSGRHKSRPFHLSSQVYSDNNDTSTDTSNIGDTSFTSLSEFSSNNKNTRSEELTQPTKDLSNDVSGSQDWSRSYHGLSAQTFPKETIDIL